MRDESKMLGENLKLIRLEKKISQSDLAKLLDVNKSFISNIENGKTNPTLTTIAKLAQVLNVPTNELLK